MTRWQRIREIAIAVVTVVFAILMLRQPAAARKVIVLIIGISMLIAAVRKLLYFFTMARYSVGGKSILYQGFILLDVALFTINVADVPGRYIMIYLIAGYVFYGAIDVMRALEIRKSDSGSWRFKMFMGLLNIAIAVICATQLESEQMTVCIYCAGMMISAVGRIINACRRSAVLYVQQN